MSKRQISVLHIKENFLNVTECDVIVDLLLNQFAKTTKVYYKYIFLEILN